MRRTFDDPDARARTVATESRERVRGQQHPRIRRDAKRDRASVLASDASELLLGLAELRLDDAGPREKRPTRGRRHHAAGGPPYELYMKLLLEAPDALRHRRL